MEAGGFRVSRGPQQIQAWYRLASFSRRRLHEDVADGFPIGIGGGVERLILRQRMQHHMQAHIVPRVHLRYLLPGRQMPDAHLPALVTPPQVEPGRPVFLLHLLITGCDGVEKLRLAEQPLPHFFRRPGQLHTEVVVFIIGQKEFRMRHHIGCIAWMYGDVNSHTSANTVKYILSQTDMLDMQVPKA